MVANVSRGFPQGLHFLGLSNGSLGFQTSGPAICRFFTDLNFKVPEVSIGFYGGARVSRVVVGFHGGARSL